MLPDETLRPVFVTRKTAAKLMEISTDTFNMWLQQGFIPPAHINRGQIVRWHWPSVEQKLAPPPEMEKPAFVMPEGPYVRPKRRRKVAQ